MKTAYKFHGAGNDFILVDSFSEEKIFTEKEIKELCNRHTGIGADGLILIEKSPAASFRMIYFNSDGKEAEMCGNGARCAFAFAFSKKYCDHKSTFEASDGLHQGEIVLEKNAEWVVRITLRVSAAPTEIKDGSYFANTGVPHNVRIIDELKSIDVKSDGSLLRHNQQLFPDGANINFVLIKNNELFIRTYERGVEDETLACGTGITASALVANKFYGISFPVTVHAVGGLLRVDEQNGFLWLEGPARHVFTSTYL
ncbi:MAG: diaminopimelate epimerase [Bacteroidetes bacterium GWF2_43_63]|nr:MAG: diaminopimelate epimerase [Bacteroidetes bacterium GWE2_42_42]OFY53331.1 MAG: diaminopimelate epimerase [Bacteroidetes bacterium GWF2_43_63]HBG71673.1 diaminopimelate epimerase [Bacteroidales bacterium]HCB61662.1 diaminopimelate epimerase [Bacteroidales bacterium]HCY22874.1 diaminopimelate epimerase [Bacteroidales bacterium]